MPPESSSGSERLRLWLERGESGFWLRDAATGDAVRWDDDRLRVVKLAGASYRAEALQDDAFAPGRRLALVPEPENEHDPNAVGIWNDYMSPLLYIDDNKKWTLQMIVRQLTAANADSANVLQQLETVTFPEQGLKFAIVVVATLPILFFYPFLQKHFAKGVLIGSVKE